MTKEVLTEHVESRATVREIAKLQGVSGTTIRYYLAKYGLHLCRGAHGKYIDGVSQPRRCACGETDPSRFYGQKRRVCAKCHNKAQHSKGRDNRLFAVEHLGGECVACGYCEHSAALSVHHTNPAIKDKNYGTMRYWSRSRLVAELAGCVLLCANCHMAFHAGQMDHETRKRLVSNK